VLQAGGNELAGICARFATAALCVVFLPTTLLGAAFPLALRLAVDKDHVGHDVGTVIGLNTLGGIVGVALTGFVLVPAVGLVRTLAALALLAALIACVAAWHGGRTLRGAVLGVSLVTVAVALLAPPQKLAELLPGARNGELTFYEEGRGGTVAVVTQGREGRSFNRLYIQGVSNTGDAMPSLRYMRLQALVPLLVQRSEPDAALVIGFGTGITAGAMLRYPGLQHPVVAELLPEVLAAASQFRGNYDAINDPRLDIRLRDGRRELLRSEQRYGVITLEPPPPSAAGVVNLYSRDFYQLAAARLQPGGVVAQWLPLPTQNADDSRALVRSFIEVFPYASLWTTEFHEMLLVGSNDPLELNVPRIRQRFAQGDVAATLAEVGVDSPEALLATWVTDRDGLQRFAGSTAPVTDDRPSIEYSTWVRADEISRVLPELLALRKAPPLLEADAGFAGAVEDQWHSLARFYQLALYAYQRDRAGWSRGVASLSPKERANPYVRWFITGQ
ncbi:MAG: fused MFS/spermidine synthase, partial [Pseudomonas sp.]